MSAEEYFNLRQSTRAYQNPYESGGIGVGGLTASARYNRQQVGSSFLSAPSGISTWNKGTSTGGGTGGYVQMPSTGPTPVTRDIERGQATGPAKPEAYVTGAAGNFGSQRIDPFDPQWSATKAVSAGVGAAIGAGIKKYGESDRAQRKADEREKRRNQKAKDRSTRKAVKAIRAGQRRAYNQMAKSPQGIQPMNWQELDRELDEGTVRKLSPEEASRYTTIGGRAIPVPGRYDPSLGWSGAGVDEWNLVLGVPSQSAIAELPSAKNRMDTSQGVTPVDVSRTPGTMNVTGAGARAPREEGPIVIGSTRALPAGGTTPQTVRSTVDEGPARVVGGIPTTNPQDRPSEESLSELRARTTAGTPAEPRVAEMSSGYTGYNPRLGSKLGRSATRGERRAVKDPNQMGLFDPNA
jgi:hypothetical protein